MEDLDRGDDEMPMMNMMKMYFHFGLGDLLLFKGMNLDTNLRLVLACLMLFLMSIVLEAMSRARICLCNSASHPQGSPATQPPVDGVYSGPCGLRMRSHRRCLQALIQFFRTFLSLTIMLAAMSYNICLIFAISLGKSHSTRQREKASHNPRLFSQNDNNNNISPP